MTIRNDLIVKAIETGEHDRVVALCEPIIYYYLHKTNFWNIFQNERDDFLQEGRVAILKCINAFDYRGRFTTFAHTAIRNAIYSYVKKMNLFNDLNGIELNDDIDYDENAIEYSSIVSDIIDDIKTHQKRDILYRYFIMGKTQVEVAKELGMSQQWVNIVVNEFKKAVRETYGIDY